MSYLTLPVEITTNATFEYRIVGPSETAPTPEAGYLIDPEPIEISGLSGNFWVEYRIVE